MLKEQFGHKMLDLFLTALAFWMAFWTQRYELGALGEPVANLFVAFLFLATLVSCSLALDFFRCYELHPRQRFDQVFIRLAKSILAAAAVVVLLLYLLQLTAGSHLLLSLFVGWELAFLTGYRALLHARRKRGRHLREILIIGSRERARELVRYITANEELGYHLIGCLDVDPQSLGSEVAEGVTVIGLMDDFGNILLNRAVDEVIFAIPLAKVDQVVDYIGFAEEQGVGVRILPDWQLPELMYQPRVASVHIENFVGLPTLELSSVPRKRLSLVIKSLFDRAMAAVALLALLPLFFLVGLLIKLTSTGPVFFRQERSGLNGRIFTLYKFRTMVAEAEQLRASLAGANEMDGPVFKIENDPRVTSIGKLLRKTSIDELPQLFNVVLGEMSLVGPRPPLPAEVREYDHWQRRRLSMKPGLTCIWQVSGRNSIGFDDWMRLDLEYIDKWSLLLDFKLLLKTVPAVLRGTGK